MMTGAVPTSQPQSGVWCPAILHAELQFLCTFMKVLWLLAHCSWRNCHVPYRPYVEPTLPVLFLEKLEGWNGKRQPDQARAGARE